MDDFSEQSEQLIQAFEAGQLEGHAVIARFVARLKEPDVAVRRDAAERLAYFGREAVDAVGPLSASLADPDAKVRMGSLRALRAIAVNSKALIQPLFKLLSDEVPNIRWTAAEMLGAIGPSASEAIPKLQELLGQDRNVRVHEAAKKSLQQIANYD